MTQEKTCGSKIRYQDKLDAVHRAKERRVKDRPFMRAYFCDVCGGYHLTKQRKRRNFKSWERHKY